MNPKEAEQIVKRLKQYKDHPVEFAADVIGADLDKWQQDVLIALRDNQKVAVAGCTGIGKDYVSACAILWFLTVNPYCKIICTAVSENTLKDNIWAQLSELIRKAPILQMLLKFTATKISVVGAESEWFCVARVAAKNPGKAGGVAQSEGLAGKYADDTLAVIDEASGVADSHFDALEGSSNTPRRKMLVIGNPLHRTGRFAQYFLDVRYKGKWWIKNVSYEESSRTSNPEAKAIRLAWIEQYGINSAYVQAKVFGRFPSSSSEDTVFNEEEVIAATERDIRDNQNERLRIGIDLARFGSDESVFIPRRGMKMLDLVAKSHLTGTQAVEVAIAIANDWCPSGQDPRVVSEFAVDETGIGVGLVDPLRDLGWSVCGVHAGTRSTMPNEYYNLISELYMEDGKHAIKVCSIKNDELLISQLLQRQFEFFQSSKQRRLVPKDVLRKKGLGSPDRADAFILAFADSRKLDLGSGDWRESLSLF